jgi:hypothetical protein
LRQTIIVLKDERTQQTEHYSDLDSISIDAAEPFAERLHLYKFRRSECRSAKRRDFTIRALQRPWIVYPSPQAFCPEIVSIERKTRRSPQIGITEKRQESCLTLVAIRTQYKPVKHISNDAAEFSPEITSIKLEYRGSAQTRSQSPRYDTV